MKHKDRMHTCVACQRVFIKRSRGSVSFCSGCKTDSMKFVALTALTLAVVFAGVAALARLVIP